eukprot:COSAG05_NODE_6501_length_946_cov_1.624557_2_plen_196_part_01
MPPFAHRRPIRTIIDSSLLLLGDEDSAEDDSESEETELNTVPNHETVAEQAADTDMASDASSLDRTDKNCEAGAGDDAAGALSVGRKRQRKRLLVVGGGGPTTVIELTPATLLALCTGSSLPDDQGTPDSTDRPKDASVNDSTATDASIKTGTREEVVGEVEGARAQVQVCDIAKAERSYGQPRGRHMRDSSFHNA